MSTSSIKSSSAKKKSAPSPAEASRAETSSTRDIPERAWKIAVLIILALAAFLRIYNLTLVPLHHDEGVNGNFLVKLVRDGAYQYDPANYHGPTLYYFSAFFPWLLRLLFGVSARETYGLNTVAIRLVPALFGLATIALVFALRRYIGTIATLCAALLLAISPGAVYLSRYFIHETLFVFFTFGIVVAGLKFYTERNPVYILVLSTSAALLFATKETAIISVIVLLIALVITVVYVRLLKPAQVQMKTKRKSKITSARSIADFVAEMGGPLNLTVWVLLAVLLFITINVVFYSSFFSNYPKGVYDALRTFDFWSKTGKEAHVHPMTTYVKWLARQELPLLLLGTVGALVSVFRPKRPVVLFCSLWGFGLIAAYSLVPYKTPWLTLNFLAPLAIAAGYAVQAVYESDERQLRLPVVILLAAVVLSTYQTVDLNFVNYDNDDTYYVYVYAHTKRDTTALVKKIDEVARQTNQGSTGITIMSPDYWPLPWYLRNYSRVGYYGRLTQTTEPIVIASETQLPDMEGTLGPDYELISSGSPTGGFALRPGVALLLYVRRH